MFASEGLQSLVRHLEWADAGLWTAVLAHGRRDAKIDEWLHHIHLVQHAFQTLWRGEPLEFRELADFADPAAVAAWGREGHAGLRKFLAEASTEVLASTLQVPWTKQLQERWKQPIQAVTIAESAVQVAMHSTHHRAQVAARLREIGGEPPLMDFIAWVWFGRPDPVWPDAVWTSAPED